MLHQYLHIIVTHSMNKQHNSAHSSELDNRQRATLMACQKIIQMLNVAETIDDRGYTATPFLTYCVFVAASVILEDAVAIGNQSKGQVDFLNQTEVDDLEYLCQKLREMGRYFSSPTANRMVIERRKKLFETNDGCLVPEEEFNHERNDTTEISDLGLVNRYSIQ